MARESAYSETKEERSGVRGTPYKPMFVKKTVLVLGAGASAPYDFPSGEELVSGIVDGLRNRSGLFERVRCCHRGQWEDFAERLVLSGTTSVDAFLEKKENEDLLRLGKDSIAAALLPMENKRKPFEAQGANWYRQLFALLTEGCSFDDFANNNLSVVTFNYDRSLEYYLMTALQHLYRARSKDECYEKLRGIKIIHVHGKLGYLPWEEVDERLQQALREPIPYGGEEHFNTQEERVAAEMSRLTAAAGNIQIISENIDQTDRLKEATALLRESSRVFLLGFGFHPTNLRRLRLDTLTRHQLKCTTHKLAADRYKLLDGYNGLTSPISPAAPHRAPSGWFDGTIDEFIQKVGLT
ncbi:MAG: hypothetical protein JW741_09060 [Sedimentisphaerales bacterium]|nr:hypothetical protein [Sedimentisphaerales bacterium]